MSTQADTKKVWCRSDLCLVQWAGDGQFYAAAIKRFTIDGDGNKKALVTFTGFSSDNDELVDLSSLKVPARKPQTPKTAGRKPIADVISVDDETDGSRETDTGMFSPLRGDEELQRLREKFQQIDREEEPSSGRSQLLTRKRRRITRVTPAAAANAPKAKDASGSSVRTAPTSSRMREGNQEGACRISSSLEEILERVGVESSDDTSSEQTESSKCTSFASPGSGFGDEDMEKPMFTQVMPLIPKRPHMLSLEGEQPVIQIPGPINQYLRDYQRAGVDFLYGHYKQGHGCLLGDDMGLGKTVQVISLIAAVLGKTGTRLDVTRMIPHFIRMLDGDAGDTSPADTGQKKVFLIIGPASVLFNWMNELETWGYFGVGKYHGTYKAETVANLKRQRLDVVVTTFETCRDNIEEINSFEWDAVFADEAHKIKGLKAEVSKALRTLKCRRRFALTGTPLQNTLDELWCILDWANPGSLGHLSRFREKFVWVIEKGQKQGSTKRELAEARKAQESLSVLRGRWMLRRTKAIIADVLPKKHELVVYCRPSQLQLDIYQALLDRSDVQLILKQHHPCDCGSGRSRGKCCHKKAPDGIHSVKGLTMTYMSLLLKTANHLALLLPEYTNVKTQSEYSGDICREVLASHPEFVQHSHTVSLSVLSQPKYCGKMKVLEGLLAVFKKDHSKVLIFSYSTRLLDIVERYVVRAGYVYRRLDGSTSQRRRAEVVTEFNRDQNIFLFLVSTKAGGVGLNLTGANKVVIFDPNWNPTHDLQAVDRAYRIGQRRDVHVLRLITTGTIEENIYLRQIYKQQLGNIATTGENARRYFHAVAGDKDNQGELFGIENTFRLTTGERSVTEDIFQRNEEIEEGLRTFDVQKYVPRQSEESDVSDAPVSDSESLDDASSSHTASDGSESDIKPVPWCRKNQDRLRPRNIIDSSTSSDPAECDSDDLHAKQPNLPVACKEKPEDVVCEPVATPQPSTSRGNSDASADRKKHTSLKTLIKERQGRRKVAWDEEINDDTQPDGGFTSISDVLENCNVAHTHCNRELIGGSKGEDHMTRCAMEDVFERHMDSQMPAMDCDPYVESSPEDQESMSGKEGGKKRKEGKLLRTSVKTIGKARVLIGQTPPAICRRLLTSMAASLDMTDPATLARQILVSTSDERLALLRTFYVGQNPALEELFTLPEKDRIPAQKQKVLRARGQREPARGSGKQGGDASGCHESKPKRRPVSRKKRVFSSSEESEECEEKETRCKKGTTLQRETQSSTWSLGGSSVMVDNKHGGSSDKHGGSSGIDNKHGGSSGIDNKHGGSSGIHDKHGGSSGIHGGRGGMIHERSGTDDATDTTHADSIDNLLDDVFGLGVDADDCDEADRLTKSRLSNDTGSNRTTRLPRNVTKHATRTPINTGTSKRVHVVIKNSTSRKVTTAKVAETLAVAHVSVKSSMSRSPVVVNTAATMDNANVKADEGVAAMLDDIFFGDGDTPAKTRRPPKHKSPRKVQRVIASRDSTESESAMKRGFSRNVNDEPSAVETSMKYDSDSSDIFSDPQKWVHTNKAHRYVVDETVDDACVADDDVYDKLLATGKLQRIEVTKNHIWGCEHSL